MINENDFKAADRAGHIIGLILSIAVYGIVLYPMFKAAVG